MSVFASALSSALIHSLWQDTVIGVLLWTVLASSRRLATNTRYAIACTALALMALVPMATAAALYMRPLPTDVRSLIASGPATARGMAAPAAEMPRAVRRPVPPSGPAGWIAQWQPWVLPLWAVGVLLFSLRLVSAGVHVRRLERRSEPADDAISRMAAVLARRLGIERPIGVLVASIADGPATLGWLRPVILLPPAALMGITSAQLEALLAHELAHIRRHDYLVNVVQMVLETVFFITRPSGGHRGGFASSGSSAATISPSSPAETP
jgi:beta-lactamase regulating signal transducer with metallopeptidase domain